MTVPRHRVINRRNTAPFVRRSLSVTPEGLDATNKLASTLGVSLGSLVDTALRELTARPHHDIIDALTDHGHLTTDERAAVEHHLKQGGWAMLTLDSPRGDEPIIVPTRPDGTPYRFEMIHANGAQRTYADSLTELLSALIPTYLTASRADADRLRLEHAVRTQVEVQAALIDQADHKDPQTCTNEERDVLLAARTTPPENIHTWTALIPLVLVDTYYHPYTERPRPDGNIMCLAPIDEATYLETLHAAGVITISETRNATTPT